MVVLHRRHGLRYDPGPYRRLPLTPDQTAPYLLPLTSRLSPDSIWTRQPGQRPLHTDGAKLTDARIAAHVRGAPLLGLAPIRPGESTTRVALLDLDSHDGATDWPGMVAAARKIAGAAVLEGLNPIPFRSSGGRGIHIAFVWDGAQDAYSVRSGMREVLAACGLQPGTGGVAAGQVEIFPKQDSVAADGRGSMFILPLGGRTQSCALDPSSFDPVPADAIVWAPSAPVLKVDRPARDDGADGIVRASADRIREVLDGIPNDGSRPDQGYDWWLPIIAGAHNASDGDDLVRDLVRGWSAQNPRFDEAEFNHVWNHLKPRPDGWGLGTLLREAHAAGWTDPVERAAILDAFDVLPPDAAADASWPPQIVRNEKGFAAPAMTNVVGGLARPQLCGAALANDAFTSRLSIGWIGDDGQPGPWLPFNDTDYTRLIRALERAQFVGVGKEKLRDAVGEVAAHHAIDSAREWLDSLPAWDGVPRIGRFFVDYFKCEAPPGYLAAVGRYTWTALAGRVHSPGVQADMVPLLIGDQGVGKTQGVKRMVPEPSWYGTIHLDAKEAEQARMVRGIVVGELEELRGLGTRDAESIKAFVSRQVERWTPKYMEFEATYPRRCLFIGTSNVREVLHDATGERRWLPMDVVSSTDLAKIDRDRDQLWAEGLARFLESGVDYADAQRLAAEQHHLFKPEDELGHRAWQYLSSIGAFDNPPKIREVSIGSLAQEALHDFRHSPKQKSNAVGRLLRNLGWERFLHGSQNHRYWMWVNPKAQDGVDVDPLS